MVKLNHAQIHNVGTCGVSHDYQKYTVEI